MPCNQIDTEKKTNRFLYLYKKAQQFCNICPKKHKIIFFFQIFNLKYFVENNLIFKNFFLS